MAALSLRDDLRDSFFLHNSTDVSMLVWQLKKTWWSPDDTSDWSFAMATWNLLGYSFGWMVGVMEDKFQEDILKVIWSIHFLFLYVGLSQVCPSMHRQSGLALPHAILLYNTIYLYFFLRDGESYDVAYKLRGGINYR